MPVESGPFGCAWSHTLPAGKAGLCSHAQAPGQAPGRPGPSLIPGLVFLHRPLWVPPTWPGPDVSTPGDLAERKALRGRGTGDRGSPPPPIPHSGPAAPKPRATRAHQGAKGVGAGGWRRCPRRQGARRLGWHWVSPNQPHFPGASILIGAQAPMEEAGGPTPACLPPCQDCLEPQHDVPALEAWGLFSGPVLGTNGRHGVRRGGLLRPP